MGSGTWTMPPFLVFFTNFLCCNILQVINHMPTLALIWC